jgi:hypothetical protein
MTDMPEMDDERQRLEAERHRLIIAASDMLQVAEAAAYLDENKHLSKMGERSYRVMWTGLVVTYARPYLRSNKLGPVEGELGKPAGTKFRTLHKSLIDRRDDLFAHNDLTDHRTVVEFAPHKPGAWEFDPNRGLNREAVTLDWDPNRGPPRFAESYTQVEYGVLPSLVQLAEYQQERFLARVDEIEEQLERLSRKG